MFFFLLIFETLRFLRAQSGITHAIRFSLYMFRYTRRFSVKGPSRVNRVTCKLFTFVLFSAFFKMNVAVSHNLLTEFHSFEIYWQYWESLFVRVLFFLRVKTAVDITGVSNMFGHTSRASSSHAIEDKSSYIHVYTYGNEWFLSLIPLT